MSAFVCCPHCGVRWSQHGTACDIRSRRTVEWDRAEIDRLRARVRELEEALRPFATRAGRSVNRLDAFWHGDWDIVERARRLLGLEVDRE